MPDALKEKHRFNPHILLSMGLTWMAIGLINHLWFFRNDWSVLYLTYGLLFFFVAVLCALASFVLYVRTYGGVRKKEMPEFRFYQKALVLASVAFILMVLLGFGSDVEDSTFLIYGFALSFVFISPYMAGVFVKRFGGGF